MSEKLDALIKLPMLQEEVKHLKEYIIILERENANLMDRLSHRRPSTAAETEMRRFCRRCAKRLLVLDPTRRTLQMPMND
jgi:RNase P subunit RPR2